VCLFSSLGGKCHRRARLRAADVIAKRLTAFVLGADGCVIFPERALRREALRASTDACHAGCHRWNSLGNRWVGVGLSGRWNGALNLVSSPNCQMPSMGPAGES